MRYVIIMAIAIGGMILAVFKPFYGLLTYLWFAYFRPQEFVWGMITELRLSYIIAVIVIISALFHKEKLFKFGFKTLLLGLIWLMCLIALSYSMDPEVSLHWFEFFSKMMIIAFLITGLVDTEQRFKYTCWIFALTVGLLGAKAGLVHAIGGGQKIIQGPGGFMQDNNAFALAMDMIIPFCFYLGLNEQGLKRAFFWIMVPFLIIGVILTYSRGGFLSLVCVILYMFFRGKSKVKWLVLLALVAIVAVKFIPDAYVDRIETIQDFDVEESAALRLHFWEVALRMIADKPFFGVGIKAYEAAYTYYDPTHGLYGLHRATHNCILEFAADNGLVASSLLWSLLIMVYISLRKIRINLGRKFSSYRNYSNMIEGAFVAYFSGGFFLSVAYSDLFFHIIALSIAFETVAQKRLKELQENELQAA